jgi:hypothetical protein
MILRPPCARLWKRFRLLQRWWTVQFEEQRAGKAVSLAINDSLSLV